MRCHANARLSPIGRRLLIDRIETDRWPVRVAAASMGISERTARKWLARFRLEGERGLVDRSSAPRRVANRTDERTVAAICALRRLRFSGPELAELLELPCSTVSAVLKRSGLGKLGRLGLGPAERSERQRPGELVHVDVKKLGRIGRPGHRVNGDRRTRSRGIGWEYVHVAIDDATRLVYVEVLDDEKAVTAVGFLRRAVAHFAAFGVRVERVMTDNGSAYRATIHALACKALGIKHLRTRPYRPRTNGKAERFIRTLLGGWAYGAIYRNSNERRDALAGWLDFYNRRRPHRSLGRQAPLERLHALNRNNVLGSYNWAAATRPSSPAIGCSAATTFAMCSSSSSSSSAAPS
jgi:transposase InsO family protein